MQYLEIGGLLTEAENSGKDINEILGESEESLSGSRQEYLNAMADSVGNVYTLTIHYQDENGNTLADDYIAQYVEGEKFSIQSPEVYGYIPNYSIITSNDQSITETQGMPSRDLEITVKYSKTAEVPEWNKNPNLAVTKEIISTPKNGTRYEAGEKITYRLTVTNTGNVTIEKFRIEDTVISNSGETQYTFTKFTDPKDQTYLEAGQTGYIDYTYTVQKADLGGTIKNTAELAETVPPVPSGHKIPPVEIPMGPESHTLTIHYWYGAIGGEAAAPTYTETFNEGDEYNVASPLIAGYNRSNARITGTMQKEDVQYDVIYTAIPYTLTINYVYEDGTTAAKTYTDTLTMESEYSVISPEIPGYTPKIQTVTGKMPGRNVTHTVIYVKNYLLTIHYWYGAIGGAVAAQTYLYRYVAGETYNVASPSRPGYAINIPRVNGTMPAKDLEFDIIYTAIPHTITINYVYEDGTTAAPQVMETHYINDTYSIISPEIPGYKASQSVVTGTMPARNLQYTVIYVPDS